MPHATSFGLDWPFIPKRHEKKLAASSRQRSHGEGMTTYGIDAGPITLVNVFEVEPAKVEAFLAGWRQRAEFMSKQPGFRSFRLLRALSPDSRFQFVNIAEWDTVDALRVATAQPYFQESIRRSIEGHGVAAHPGIYRVAVEVTAR
jgi:heme-degrading monooxygenase HmoA